MYIPKQFQLEDKLPLIEAIRDIKLGVLIIFAENRFFASHIPFLIKEQNEKLVLEGHVSKANDLWKVALPQNKAMVIFQGPNAYIHPGWYPLKAKTGKVVPTWNYQVVHWYGHAENIQSEQWLLEHVNELTHHKEKEHENPWSVSDAPEEYIEALVKGIVGIRVHLEDIEGSLKMNQHHPEENRLGVIEGLSKSSKPYECEVAQIMCGLESLS